MPGIYDPALPDRTVHVPRKTHGRWPGSGTAAGLFVGVSGGGIVVASIAVAKELTAGTVVTILPDDGNKYLSLGIFG